MPTGRDAEGLLKIRQQARVLSDICLDPATMTAVEESLHPRSFNSAEPGLPGTTHGCRNAQGSCDRLQDRPAGIRFLFQLVAATASADARS